MCTYHIDHEAFATGKRIDRAERYSSRFHTTRSMLLAWDLDILPVGSNKVDEKRLLRYQQRGRTWPIEDFGC